MHKNKTKWREGFQHGEGRRWKEKKENVQIQKNQFDQSISNHKVR